MFARPRLPRPNAIRKCNPPSILAWPTIQTIRYSSFKRRRRSETHESAALARPSIQRSQRFQTTRVRGVKRRQSETHEPATLAWLLGYGDQVQPSGAPWPDLSKLVLENANLSLRNVRFLSIDIDGLHQDKAGIRQFDIGVSILDTEQIYQQLKLPPNRRKNLAVHLIKSRHYAVEDTRHDIAKRINFSFGGCRVMSLPKLRQKLKDKVEGRNVVLVMHGAATEVSVMKSLNINLNPVFTIDTTTTVRHLFRRTNLKHLLEVYRIPHKSRSLHHAGNDAHFILRVLLMIAVHHVRAKLGGAQLPDWVPVFETVARSPKPELEEMRKEGPLRITPGHKELKQMERRRETLERIARRLEKPSKEEEEMMPWRMVQVQPTLPDCDAMSPPWADRYTISQYGMLP
ncbi:uncharacterized protein NECHADRAFT_102134 [Fusarium vanettenii 77-13-4]|uniref:Gfd2/YDR514C-like C-terminal domain-containing protein n=1 Tax=Fusarium vanettenii (strain ATCC MYA-4622 / CBS 123669 / FGSC 9596 / NRRL 45880 / 77-13-4) TaxID=660122 RepID=C7ZEH4_FUSV7|nr:uncharacterized protein NECHADRAFT_102134 [Fusarium vanettenii 77-13-4]EEU37596.1 hypothetical protein NECHADRAFT_102134 [Fusarium vanettenii 77-13-4]